MARTKEWQSLLKHANKDLKRYGIELIVKKDEEDFGYYFLDISYSNHVEDYAANYFENELYDLINDAWHHSLGQVLNKPQELYLFYRGDSWLTYSSLELVMVCDNIETGIRECQYSSKIDDKMTAEQAEQVRSMNQSQCNNVDYEWFVQTIKINEVI